MWSASGQGLGWPCLASSNGPLTLLCQDSHYSTTRPAVSPRGCLAMSGTFVAVTTGDGWALLASSGYRRGMSAYCPASPRTAPRAENQPRSLLCRGGMPSVIACACPPRSTPVQASSTWYLQPKANLRRKNPFLRASVMRWSVRPTRRRLPGIPQARGCLCCQPSRRDGRRRPEAQGSLARAGGSPVCESTPLRTIRFLDHLPQGHGSRFPACPCLANSGLQDRSGPP